MSCPENCLQCNEGVCHKPDTGYFLHTKYAVDEVTFEFNEEDFEVKVLQCSRMEKN
jgi:hypothetical protein